MGMTKIIACQTIEDEIKKVIPEQVEAQYMEYALHRHPDKLRREVQLAIDESSEHDTILLGYGLCSNGTAGLSSKDKRLVVPRVHDCISILLGSRDKYQQEFEKHPGTIYLSKGWLDHGGDPYSCYQDYREEYGEESALWILDQEYKNYQRLAFINTPVGELEEYRRLSREISRLLGLEYLELEGSLVMLEDLLQGRWEQDFITVPPGKMVIEHHFR